MISPLRVTLRTSGCALHPQGTCSLGTRPRVTPSFSPALGVPWAQAVPGHSWGKAGPAQADWQTSVGDGIAGQGASTQEALGHGSCSSCKSGGTVSLLFGLKGLGQLPSCPQPWHSQGGKEWGHVAP